MSVRFLELTGESISLLRRIVAEYLREGVAAHNPIDSTDPKASPLLRDDQRSIRKRDVTIPAVWIAIAGVLIATIVAILIGR